MRVRSAGSSAVEGLLQHFLVAALHRALALAEGDDIAVRVGQELDLHVPRPFHVALREHRVLPERRLGLRRAAASASSSSSAARTTRIPRPPPPAAAFRIREDRALRLACLDDGTPASRAIRFDSSLSPAASARRAAVPPGEAGRLDGTRELRVFGEEAVARMDRVRADDAAARTCSPASR